ncbi:TPA: hypothetical protein ACSP8B_004008 [Aeromonas veronii]
MIFLSERVQKEMYSEAASIWIVPALDKNYKTVIVMKLTSAPIKAMITNCKFEVSIAFHSNVLMCALTVYDIPESPLIVSKCISIEEELFSITELLNKKKALLFIFNELDICIGWTYAELNGPGTKLRDIICNNQPYLGKFNHICSDALDLLQLALDNKVEFQNHNKIDVYTFEGKAEEWNINTNIFIGINDQYPMTVDNKNEGEMFERSIWSSLTSVFPFTLYKSPQVNIGDKSREFTDILAFDELGAILIESKDLSVIQAGFERSMERRVAGVKKQAKKAIGQLVGACNALSRDEKIYDLNGNKLDIKGDAPHHCIVLVTEINHHGDWNNIVEDLIDAFKETKCFFHTLDLRELISILKLSRSCPITLRKILVKRFQNFFQMKSVHIRFEKRS